MRRFLILTLLLLLFSSSLHAAPPNIAGCDIFPADNAWNTDISTAPVHPNSKNYIKNILDHGGNNVHPDFGGGTNDWYGIPWDEVSNAVTPMDVEFDYDDESDPGPYPIPDDVRIEGGGDQDGDRHALLLNSDTCVLYELFYLYPVEVGGNIVSWTAGSGAIWDLSENEIHPEFWTSADASGLPILPGLAMCEQAESPEGITHALRFTVEETQRAFVYPASHYASSNTGANFPPMGLRLRLKANYNESGFEGQALAIVKALKKYGMILADNGSNFFISGEYNPNCWDDDQLNDLKGIPGNAFEVVVSPPPPPEVDGDLMKNGSFEAGTPKGKTPQFWTVSLHKDRRQCDRDGNVYANTGRCAFEFKGSGAGHADYITQVVRPVGELLENQIVTISMAVERNNVPEGAAKIKLKLIYDDGSDSETVNLDAGSASYEVNTATIDGAETAGLKKIKLKFIYKGKSGSLLLDSLSVVVDAARGVLPAPPPAG